MYYGKETSRTSIKVPDYGFLQNIENSEPNWSRRGAPGGPGAPLARPTSWPRREAAWAPRSASPTPLWLVTFLLLQNVLLPICPDSPGTVSLDFACFLLELFLPGNLSARPRCHGFPKFPLGQVHHQRHQPLPRWLEESALYQEDLKEHVKEGRIKARLEGMEQEFFKCKKMVERGVEANFDLVNDLKAFYKKEMKEMWKCITSSEEKIEELQGKIYDLHHQNCEYELRFMRMGMGAACRIPETDFSYETREPLPWKRFAEDYADQHEQE